MSCFDLRSKFLIFGFKSFHFLFLCKSRPSFSFFACLTLSQFSNFIILFINLPL